MSATPSKRIVAITGSPGVGKSTLVKHVVEKLQSSGIDCCGFYTEEVRKGGSRIGFDVVTLDGKVGPLARIQSNEGSRCRQKGPMVGKYSVDITSFESLSLPLLNPMILQTFKLLVVDEIGKMELFSKTFENLMRQILHNKEIKILTTIPSSRGKPIQLVEEIRNSKECSVIQLTTDNRNDPNIPTTIINTLMPKS